ncbi:hypothetical protein Hanom_Chr08g00729221 [Helianthus anomalus]
MNLKKKASSSPTSCYHGFFLSGDGLHRLRLGKPKRAHPSTPSPHRYILPNVAVNLFSCLRILLSPILSCGHLPPAPDRHITYDLP